MSAALPPCPPELKPLAKIFKLAKSFDRSAPALSYYARLMALERGLGQHRGKDDNYLLQVMDAVEKDKTALTEAGNEAIQNKLVAHTQIEDLGLKYFAQADKQDRAGVATVKTAQAFLMGQQIFEVALTLSTTANEEGEEPDKMIEMSKYAKWRAAEIAKCVREGTPITPPAPDVAETEDPGMGMGMGMGMDTGMGMGMGAGNDLAAQFANVSGGGGGGGQAPPTDMAAQFAQHAEQHAHTNQGGTDLAAQFANVSGGGGGGGADLASQFAHLDTGAEQQPQYPPQAPQAQPPQQQYQPQPTPQQPPQQPPQPAFVPQAQPYPPQAAPQQTTFTPPAQNFAPQQPPQQQQQQYPPQQAPQSAMAAQFANYHQQHPAQVQAPPPQQAVGGAKGSYVPKGEISYEDSNQATKNCKFAISALQYSDTKTAVENLLKALDLLTR